VASYRLQELTGIPDLRNFVENLKSMSPAARDALLSAMPQPDGTLLEKREPMNATLEWEDVAHLRYCGFSFGSHTWSHQILTQIPPAAVNHELSNSKCEIEARLKKPCETFAYPNGNWSNEIRDAVARNGYKLAFTTESGLWTREDDPLRIPRVNISENYIVNLSGHFSRPMFEYRVFWCAGK
jgi:peptidoglycan/xylan/chitin deacetylase (PgdA/CDA1 family)